MSVRRAILVGLSLAFLTQGVLAESAGYHLKRLEIQARAFLAQLDDQPAELPEGASVQEQLDSNLNSGSTWAEDMVREDVRSLLSATPTLLESLKSGNEEEYSRARVELESLARRLRISTSPLELEPQQQASLDLLMLELEESASVMNQEREQLAARKETRRRRSNVSIGVGYGWGGWGPWSPWGYNRWGGYYGGYYSPRRIYRRPYCR